MNELNFSKIFQNAFDTFKVFETIPIEISGILIDGHSTTIWQTLTHLIKWREYRILQINDINTIAAIQTINDSINFISMLSFV